MFGTSPLWAYPEIGSPAPPLKPMTLLQAPPGAKAGWASMKGKVVVLDFWATWCAPCIASLPHFNQLAESLDPAKFRFISIDDEDTKVVQGFLSKKKMSGWVGVDTSGSAFASYGIYARGITIIVDGNGRIAAITQIESVSAADLQAIADGKKVSFKTAPEIIKGSASGPDTEQTLFAVSLTKAAADAKMSIVEHAPTGTDYLGQDADSLLTDVLNVFGERYVLKSPLPDDHYDLRINSGDIPDAVIAPMVQRAVLARLHLQIQPRTITRHVYILRATDASRKLLSASASTHAVKRGYWHGIYVLMNGSMDDLAYLLGAGLEAPVINDDRYRWHLRRPLQS
jgi:thiol-disulfide isomerase/thioredoxin